MASKRSVRRLGWPVRNHRVPRADHPARRAWVQPVVAVLPVVRSKRVADWLWVLVLLPWVLLVLPVLYVWVQWVSPGGGFIYAQTRIGRGGKPFTLYKIRTMRPGADTAVHDAHVLRLIQGDQPLSKLDCGGDNRLIRGGWFIRMAGLDELPQLLNVLRGEMSMVGPRPCTPAEFALYDVAQRRRFAIHPGLTGLWQVERDAATTFRQMVQMDLSYLERASWLLDWQLVLRTPGSLAAQIGACARVRLQQSAVWQRALNRWRATRAFAQRVAATRATRRQYPGDVIRERS